MGFQADSELAPGSARKRKLLSLKVILLTSLFIVAATSFGSSPQTQTIVSVGGDWTITFSQGGAPALLTIKQDGDKITAAIKYDSGGERNGSGFVKGNEIEWTEIVKSVGVTVTIVTEAGKEQKAGKHDVNREYIYKGKIEGNVITGYFYFKGNEGRQFEWKATKKK
jgi:hypothetical protein